MRKPLPDFLRYRMRQAAAASARERRDAPETNAPIDAAEAEARCDEPAIEGPHHGLNLNSRSASARFFSSIDPPS